MIGLGFDFSGWFVEYENNSLSSTPKCFSPASSLLRFIPSSIPNHLAASEPALKPKDETKPKICFLFYLW